jgi:hypothetical protein
MANINLNIDFGGNCSFAKAVEATNGFVVGSDNYSGAVEGGSLPVPSAGTGTTIFNGDALLSWDGTKWVGAKDPTVLPVRTVTSSVTVLPTDCIILVNNGSSSVTITLPSAVGRVGKRFVVQRASNLSTGQIAVAVAGGANVVGADGNPFSYCIVPYYYEGKSTLNLVSDNAIYRFIGY